jgi:hypothetical protein
MPLKLKQSSRKQKAADMCELFDRNKTGEIPLEQFKRICVACKVQVAVNDEFVNYK